MTKILVVAEHFDGEIISSTSKTVNCASQIPETITGFLPNLSDRKPMKGWAVARPNR